MATAKVTWLPRAYLAPSRLAPANEEAMEMCWHECDPRPRHRHHRVPGSPSSTLATPRERAAKHSVTFSPYTDKEAKSGKSWLTRCPDRYIHTLDNAERYEIAGQEFSVRAMAPHYVEFESLATTFGGPMAAPAMPASSCSTRPATSSGAPRFRHGASSASSGSSRR